MARKNNGTPLSERAIRAMPYESRIIHYNREKDELFNSIRDMPASEVQRRHEELVKKWGV